MRPNRRRWGPVAGMLVALSGLGWSGSAAAQALLNDVANPVPVAALDLRSRAGSVVGLMGYNATPDGSANAVTVNRRSATPGGRDAAPELDLGQFGFGFTVSETVPLFLE